MVFVTFWSENRYGLCLFGLNSGMVFEGIQECMNIFVISIPNEYERMSNNYANSK